VNTHPTVLADWIIVLPVLLGIVGGAILLMARRSLKLQPWFGLLVLAAIVVCDVALLARVLADGPVSMTIGNWLAPFGISFTVDVMGAGFALVAAFVAFAVTLSLMTEAPEAAVRDGLYPLVLLLVAGVSGAFLTGDLFNLYVWFEVMLIASFGLIMIAGQPIQLDGAVKYGVLNLLATTLFLIGLGLLYGQLGTLNMADIIGKAARADPAPLAATAALFALAFGMKAAIFPVNAWLPASYHTPPAAISALMGGLLTKVGVYALLRLFVMLLPGARAPLGPTLEGLAIATMILGPLSAIAETNLRRAIGFVLIGGIGVSLACLPSGHQQAVFGSQVYVVHSMLTLAALYLLAGAIERSTGATDTLNMGRQHSPGSPLSAMFLVMVLAIAGVPPFLGFWPKLLLLQDFTATGDWPLVFALLANGLLTLIAGIRLWSRIFWQPSGEPAGRPRGLAPALLLTGTILFLGVWPSLLLNAGLVASQQLVNASSYVAAVGLAP
jgi:multicomponent Na+:H+ antiporter subunit D